MVAISEICSRLEIETCNATVNSVETGETPQSKAKQPMNNQVTNTYIMCLLVLPSICVCVFFTLNRSSTRRHPAHPVSVLILHPRKISSVVTSYDTEIMHRNAFDNAVSCPSTGYDRHNIHTSATEIQWKREIRNKQKQKQKQKTKTK